MRKYIFLLTYACLFLPCFGKSFSPSSAFPAILYSSALRDSSHIDPPDPTGGKGKEQYGNPQQGRRINKIVLDAGHGGKDPGCSGAYSKEKHITLAIVKKAGELIQLRYPDMEIIYTRDKDVFIPLNERANIANRNKADLFISVHCNALPNGAQAKGSETYVLGLHRQESNLAVAKRENAAVALEDNYTQNYGGFDPNTDEGYIFLSMFQSAYMEQSMQFAALVEKHMVKKTGRKSYGVKQAGFVVLWATAMPSILIETGYLTNSEEEKLLSSESGQTDFAQIIVSALDEYMTGESTVASVPPHPSPAAPVQSDTPSQVPAKAEFVKNPPPRTQPVPLNKSNSIAAAPVVFKVQLAASSAEINTRLAPWSQLDQLEKVLENNMNKYLSGGFSSMAEATAYRDKLKTMGFADAFVVAYQGNTRLAMDQALRMTSRQ